MKTDLLYLMDLPLRFVHWISWCINRWFSNIIASIITHRTSNILHFDNNEKVPITIKKNLRNYLYD